MDEETEELEVDLVEFTMAVRNLLERKTSSSRRWKGNLRGFPRFLSWKNKWPGQGWVPAKRNMARILDQLQLLTARLDSLQTAKKRPPAAKAATFVQARSKARAAGTTTPDVQEDPEDVRAAMQSVLRGKPKHIPDEPGRRTTAVEAAEVISGLEAAGSNVKLSTLKLLKDFHQGKKKKNKKPGLANYEEDSSSNEDAEWTTSSRGGKGIEAAEKLRVAMARNPEAYQSRMESKMMKAVKCTEIKFIRAAPVTGGYALAGYAEILKLMVENKPRQARLHTLKMMAAMEQFLIDENWTVAARLIGGEEPPWGLWSAQDLGALRRQYV